MAVKVTSRPIYQSLVSPGSDRQSPIYNWHSFKHSYSKSLVQNLIQEFGLKKNSWILDPFCGGGTTLLSSKQMGVNSRGYDILPFSVFLSNTKVQEYDEPALLQDLLRFRNQTIVPEFSASLPTDIGILDKAFSPEIKKELLRLKAEINSLRDEKNRNFFNLAFLGILEPVSNTMKAGGFLRLVQKNESPANIRIDFLERCTSMLGDVMTTKNLVAANSAIASARLRDARNLDSDRKFDAVITSPPYPNRHDYTRIYALEMVFDFVANNSELKDIRYKTLRSHVEARKQFEAIGYDEPKKLTRLITKIEENGTNNIQVPAMIRGYFEDMYLALSQMRKYLKAKGNAAIVVSNVRFSGINVPVDILLAKIGIATGFKSAKIWTARNRGNSPQQMRDYSRKTSRESIIILSR